MKKLLLFILLFSVFLNPLFSEDNPPVPGDAKTWAENLGSEGTVENIGGSNGMLIKSLGNNFNWDIVSAFSQAYTGMLTEPQQCTVSTNLRDLVMPAVFVGFIILIAVAILYMVGQVLQMQNIIALAKEEINVSTQTIVITIFFATAIFGAGEWLGIVANQNDPIYRTAPSIIDASMMYSQFLIYQISSQLSAMLVFNTFLNTIYTATVYVGVTLKAMFSFNVGPILKPIVDILGIVIQFLSTALGEWILHYVILCFIKRWTWSLFIPLGMLLRAIPQTREAGNAVFAIFLSLSFIYPILIIGNWEIYKITSYSITPGDSIVSEFFESSGIFGVGLFGLLLMFLLGSVIIPFIMGLMINIVFELVKTSVYYIVIISVLLPFLNIFITLTAAREVARGFGSEINFTAFVKLI